MRNVDRLQVESRKGLNAFVRDFRPGKVKVPELSQARKVLETVVRYPRPSQRQFAQAMQVTQDTQTRISNRVVGKVQVLEIFEGTKFHQTGVAKVAVHEFNVV